MELLKITYHHASGSKMNTYMPAGGPFKKLVESVEEYLFEKREVARSEMKFYWVDNEGDEIDIVSEMDFKIFLEMSVPNSSRHIHVAPMPSSTLNKADGPKSKEGEKQSPTSSEPETQIPPADDNNVHFNVECDSCLASPIVGFRYKCIQCSNYDLCQNCEAKHVHPEHMMVRMPNKGCPYIIDAFITRGRKSGRKYEKRCKSGETPRFPCGFASASAGAGGVATGSGEKSGESTDANGQEGQRHGRKHRRHVRHNFLSNLYEMMHDLAEGGGDAAVAAAMGREEPTTAQEGATNGAGNTTQAADAFAAAENAKKVAAKAAEVAAKVTHQAALSAAAAAAAAGLNNRDGPTTSFQTAQQPCQTVPVFPSPSLENLSQFLSPQYMKAGIDILHNFSDMFAKMLDPVDVGDSLSTSSCPFVSKSSTTSTQSTNSKKSNDSMKTCDSQSVQDNKQNESDTIKASENAQNENKSKSINNSLVDVMDLGSDSESDGVTEGFVKLNAPTKENTPEKAKDSSATSETTSNDSTAPQSLNKSEVMDFAQLSADLKAHIAQEQQKEEGKVTNKTAEAAPQLERELRAVPVFKQKDTQDKPEENVPIYHSDERINSAVRAMMSMGFANEGAMLTQLLESVNGNISEAIDILMATQQ